MRRLGLQGEDRLAVYRTFLRNVPTAFAVVMLAGVALPAEARNAKDGSVEPAVAIAEPAPAVAPAAAHGGAVLHVEFGLRGPRVDVLPRNVESLEAASRRAAAAAG